MNTKIYLMVTGILFGIIAVVHLLRLIYQWPVKINAVAVPVWASCAGLLIALVLCAWAFLLLAVQTRAGKPAAG
jgi:hypothetical protein